MSCVHIVLIALLLSIVPTMIIVMVCVEQYKKEKFLEKIKPGTKLGWVNTLYHRGSPFAEFYDKQHISFIIVTDIKSNNHGDVYIQYKRDGFDKLYDSPLKTIYRCYNIIE